MKSEYIFSHIVYIYTNRKRKKYYEALRPLPGNKDGEKVPSKLKVTPSI